MLLSMLAPSTGSSSQPQQQEVTSGELAEIKYLYDISGESIYGTPEQEALYKSPYASGGTVNMSNDELLKYLFGDR